MTVETEPSLRDDLQTMVSSAGESAPLDAGAGDAPPIPADLPALEAPSMWGKPYKEAFGKIAGHPEFRPVAEAWQGHWKETQGYLTKKEQEYADYRKRFDPIGELVKPYEGYWQMQGMDTRQGLGQLLAYAEQLAKNPKDMIPQLAKMYGVDLHGLVAEQPYVDPQVAQLQARIDELQRLHQTGAQQQQSALQHRLQEEIRSFETAVDESGKPKAPHFNRVFDRMLGLARGGLTNSIQEAYEMAVALDKELQAELAKEAQNQEAIRKAAEAKKALDASRTVKSKATAAGAPPARSLRDDIRASMNEMT